MTETKPDLRIALMLKVATWRCELKDGTIPTDNDFGRGMWKVGGLIIAPNIPNVNGGN